MKDPVRRDNILTITGLSLMAGVFVFAVYLPGHKACERVRGEIQAAEQSIQAIPLRLAELEKLKGDVAKRQAYLQEMQRAVPMDAAIHDVIREVSDLARQSDLQVTRLEPLKLIGYESYERFPFRLTCRGKFRSLLAFARGLEDRSRLFLVDELKLSRESKGTGEDVDGDIYFSVYRNLNDSSESDEKEKSSEVSAADTGDKT